MKTYPYERYLRDDRILLIFESVTFYSCRCLALKGAGTVLMNVYKYLVA